MGKGSGIGAVENMARLHEYQGKALLADSGINVPRGRAVRSAEEAKQVAVEIGVIASGSTVAA